MPTPDAWRRECAKSQLRSLARREPAAVRRHRRAQIRRDAWDAFRLLVLFATAVVFVLWLLGVFR